MVDHEERAAAKMRRKGTKEGKKQWFIRRNTGRKIKFKGEDSQVKLSFKSEQYHATKFLYDSMILILDMIFYRSIENGSLLHRSREE